MTDIIAASIILPDLDGPLVRLVYMTPTLYRVINRARTIDYGWLINIPDEHGGWYEARDHAGTIWAYSTREDPVDIAERMVTRMVQYAARSAKETNPTSM